MVIGSDIDSSGGAVKYWSIERNVVAI